ncbi:MAG: fibronectin type III domain-containing protein [Anaerolineales bacterium]|nr:fibronectin type III domain-containing protein [Anaerolineales bacterium]
MTQGASGTAATLSWRSGTGGTSQVVYVGSNQNSVNNDCAYGGCIISDVALSPFYANYNFSYPVTGLTPNTTYYFRVVTQENSSCRPSAIFDASIDIY